VGATNTPCAFPCPASTLPNDSGNPTYNKGDLQGSNTTTLTTAQIPSHTHAATVVINDPGHSHTYTLTNVVGGSDDTAEGTHPTQTPNTSTSTNVTGLKGTGSGQNVFVNNAEFGGGSWHSNVQPGLALYYIQYRPV